MKSFIFFFLLLQISVYSQSNTTHFNHQIFEVYGDLNKDRLADKVIVTQDTLAATAPYRLQIFLAQPNGSFQRIVTTTKFIEPQYSNGRDGYRSGNGLGEIVIKNGILNFNFQLLRGHYEYKFRFQNGHFELIGYTEGQSDGLGHLYYTDFNLSTGVKIEKTENYQTDEIIRNIKRKLLIRPLPKIQDIIPFENDDYLH